MDLNVTQDLIKAIGTSGSLEEIRAAAILEARNQQTAADTDAVTQAEATRVAVEQQAQEEADKVYTITENIKGRDFEFTAGSQEELTNMVLNAHRVANSVRSEQIVEQVQQIAEPVGPTPEEIEAARAELERKFRLSEISVKDYIEQSGAVSDYLASQGLSVDTLRNTVESTQSRATIQSWQEATEIFKEGPGQEWPGSERNMLMLGNRLQELGLDDAEDKVGALIAAYSSLKQDNMLFELTPEERRAAGYKEEVAPEPVATVVQTAQPVVQQAPIRQQPVQQRTSSSLFGASTGVPANTQPKADTQQKFEIDPNADPRQIMEVWKRKMTEQKIDPNAAFMESFSSRK
jgi:hypothetical protein